MLTLVHYDCRKEKSTWLEVIVRSTARGRRGIEARQTIGQWTPTCQMKQGARMNEVDPEGDPEVVQGRTEASEGRTILASATIMHCTKTALAGPGGGP